MAAPLAFGIITQSVGRETCPGSACPDSQTSVSAPNLPWLELMCASVCVCVCGSVYVTSVRHVPGASVRVSRSLEALSLKQQKSVRGYLQ